ncbi:DUF4150 domain-containing protein [Pseudomonas sp. NA13]
MAKDTTRGTRTVKITGKEVMLKDKSCFKTSTGDEAGNAPKKGVVTSKIKGKVYFIAWSMDVKFEGENVVRHLDLMTHNHASKPGNTPPWAYADAAATTPIERCKKEVARKNKACGDCRPKRSGVTTRPVRPQKVFAGVQEAGGFQGAEQSSGLLSWRNRPPPR